MGSKAWKDYYVVLVLHLHCNIFMSDNGVELDWNCIYNCAAYKRWHWLILCSSWVQLRWPLTKVSNDNKRQVILKHCARTENTVFTTVNMVFLTI